VPITARLSQKFYEKFGQDVTNELVDWFNSVDATYRADLGELNEANFARFDARLERRLAELNAELAANWERGIAELKIELADVKSGLKWMLVFWAPTALAVIGTGAGVIGLLLRR
jgi:hypothetical protein